MLYIGKEDIEKAANFEEILDRIELAFGLYENKEYTMPSRIHINNNENTLLYMPCFIESIFGTKILTVFPRNTLEDQPVIDGLMLLNERETGKPLAIINGAKLTAVRTGAVGGCAIKNLTPETVRTVGLIGAGTQGLYQLLFASKVREFKEIYVYDINRSKVDTLVRELKVLLPHIQIQSVDTVEKLLMKSEVIITATTSQKPVLPNDEKLLLNRYFIGIGSFKPTMREYPAALFKLVDRIFIDTEYALEESGDLIDPISKGWITKDKIENFGHYLNYEKGDRENLSGTILFKTVGMALFDVVVSELIYKNSVNKEIGTEIQL